MDDILNWLLQGGIVAFAMAAALRVIEPHAVRVRTGVLRLALVLVLALPALPFVFSAALPAADNMTLAAYPPAVVVLAEGLWTSRVLVSGLWIVWSCASIGQVVRAAAALRRARRACRPFPEDVESRLRSWMRVRSQGRPARLMLSSDVASAAVLGYRSPLIVVAPALLEHLDPEDLDRIVIHEWAHVQRWDDLAHGLHLAVRVVAGWHPAVWWIERQLRVEREVACDVTAVAVIGSAKAYAGSLLRLASLPVRQRAWVPALAAATGLRHRIVRILACRGASIQNRWGVAIGASAVLSATAFAVGGLQLVDVEAARHAADLTLRSISLPADRRTEAPQNRSRPAARADARRIAAVRGGSEAAATPRPALQTAAAELPPPSPVDETAVPRPANAEPLAATTIPSPHPLGVVDATASRLPSRDATASVAPASRWSAAADAGVSVGQTSQKAALATAGFFSRFGKRIAGSF